MYEKGTEMTTELEEDIFSEKESYRCMKGTETRYIWDNYILKPTLCAFLLILVIVALHFLNAYILLHLSDLVNHEKYNTTNGCPLLIGQIECKENERLSIYFDMNYRILSAYGFYLTLLVLIVIGFFIGLAEVILLCYEQTKRDTALYLIGELPDVPKMDNIVVSDNNNNDEKDQQSSKTVAVMDFDFDSDSDIFDDDEKT